MRIDKKFIWLDPKHYPEYQSGKFSVVEFKRVIQADQPIEIEICALARYMLFVNGNYIGRGPTSACGDYVNFGKIEEPYFDTYSLDYKGDIEIKVLVTSVPTVLNEYDFGHSGLWLRVNSLDITRCETDENWDVRLLSERKDVLFTDYTEKEEPYCKAKFIEKTFNLEKSPVALLDEEKISPLNFTKLRVEGKKSGKTCLLFDKIYSAYPNLFIKCDGECTVKMISTEEGDAGRIEETIVTDRAVHHFSPRMRSIGQIEIEIVNNGDSPVCLEEVYIDYIHYPVYEEGKFVSSDSFINKLYDVCMHTLKICRQSMHLDSPTHQEPLACTGDYYIQALIEYLSLGDCTLAEWDIKRTSRILRVQNGRLFHTTYSLIYPWWVYDHYMHTGDASVIDKQAIELLLNRFDSYMCRENGLLEFAPDYMFVDWVVASSERDEFLDGGNMMSHGKMQGYSLHHPPKALGQSVLCMLYYNALTKIAELYKVLNDQKSAGECLKKAENLKKSINEHLYDKKKSLYVGGLNTPDRVEENGWLPKNTSVVYYLKQANVLSVLFGIAPKESRRGILEYVVKGLNKYEMQPYFYHFLLNALYDEGMFEEHGLRLIREYKSLIERCDKGLSEAWENMKCDYSHAWGATPAYTLKRALSGLEILEPGFKKIKLSPKLYDLESVDMEITTPYGKIEICQKKGEHVSIKAPKEIEIVE